MGTTAIATKNTVGYASLKYEWYVLTLCCLHKVMMILMVYK
jgi:hypothetical protein